MSYKVKAVVDRFEGNKAVLLVGEEELQTVWPRSFMPEKLEEGSVLEVTMQIDAEATTKARGEAQDLLRQILAQNNRE